MRNIIFFLSMFCALGKAQNNFIVYDKIIDIADGNEKIIEKNILGFDNESSIFFNYHGSLENVTQFLKNDEKVRSSKVVKNIFNEKYFLLKDNSFTREILFSQDNYQNFNWKIFQNERLYILGYKCNKAIGYFRGREYIAWFSSELSIDVGPLKFRGLPGTILKISDKDNLVTFEATKVILNLPQRIDLTPKFSFYFPSEEKKNYMNYKQFIDLENKSITDFMEKVAANRPKGSNPIEVSESREYEIEKTFEWEEESKKP